MFGWLWALVGRKVDPASPVCVTFDQVAITIYRKTTLSETTSAKLDWSMITRICFHATDYLEPDALYLFHKERDESHTIPMDADGASALWEEIIKRDLFDATYAVIAATSLGGLFCWPDLEESTVGSGEETPV